MELVTILVPSYNHQDFIDTSLNSIINQSYKDIELIIIDDGSMDNSFEKILAFEDLLRDRFSKVQILKQENQGICNTFNRGLNLATGKYFCIMPSDDLMHEEFVLKQVNFLRKTNNDFSFTNGYHVPNFLMIRKRFEKGFSFDTRYNCNPFEEDFIYKNVFTLPSPSFMYKTEILKEVSGFDSDLTFEDVDIVLRLNEKFKLGYINEYLFYHRIHNNNSGSNKNIINKGLKLLRKKFVEENILNLQIEKVKLIENHFEEITKNFNSDKTKSLYNLDIERLLSISRQKHIIAWGTGSFSEKFLDSYPEVKIEYLIDSNKTGQLRGYDIYAPTKILEETRNIFIVILSDFFQEISKQLLEMGFQEEIDFY